MPAVFPRAFYERSAVEVARNLLGARLVRIQNGVRISGLINETEAYQGESDLACHAKAGRTPRTRVMYGAPGHAYVYFTYGAHWMLNVVAEPVDQPAAVLIRGMLPVEGLDQMESNRPRISNKPEQPISKGWTDGPAKVCQALAITGRLNGIDLCDPFGELYIEPGYPVAEEAFVTTPRIGINNVPEPWKSKPWRFLVRDLQSLHS